jgi:hypothetical protein
LTKFLKEHFITVELVPVKNHVEGRGDTKRPLDGFASNRSILIGLAVTEKDPARFGLANVLFSYEPYGFMLRRNDGAFRLAVNEHWPCSTVQVRLSLSTNVSSAVWASPVRRFRLCIFSNGLPE